MSDTKYKRMFPEGVLCFHGLNETQSDLMDRMVYAIIRPGLSLGLDSVSIEKFTKHVVDKSNEYAEFLSILGGDNYYAQLTLENVIEALKKNHDAPKPLTDALQVWV